MAKAQESTISIQGNPTACCQDAASHIRVHRSWRSVVLRFALSILVAGIVLWASVAFSLFGADIRLGSNLNLTLPLFLLIALVLVARPLFLMFDCRHEIACHHVRSIHGRLSMQRDFVEVPYEEALGVRAEQGLIERILGVGSLVVWTASANHPEITMRGIRNPQHYARLIGSKIDAVRIKKKRSFSSLEP